MLGRYRLLLYAAGMLLTLTVVGILAQDEPGPGSGSDSDGGALWILVVIIAAVVYLAAVAAIEIFLAWRQYRETMRDRQPT